MGTGLHQLNQSRGLYVDEHETIYVADTYNHRVVAWPAGKMDGELVAGSGKAGKALDQLNLPTDVIMDQSTQSLLICDSGNERVVRWSKSGGHRGNLFLYNIGCYGLTMDDRGFLYVTIILEFSVRLFKYGDPQGTVVAGGNGQGDRLDQLNNGLFVFVDRDHSVYVSDQVNSRVVKWLEGAKEGTVVAGGNGNGNHLKQLRYPAGVVVDGMGTVYVADTRNHRVVRWPQNATEGDVVVGGIGFGDSCNQLNQALGVCFDIHGHLFVVDSENNRVQKYFYAGRWH